MQGDETQIDPFVSFARHALSYRFQTLNPLSVKTKVHLPNGPSSSLSPTLRNLVYLELHLQNTSPLPLQFSRMAFEPISGLTYKTLHDDLRDDKSADGAQIDPNDVARVGGVMNPGDIRQVCFIVDETGREGGIVDGIKTIWEPGTVLPLGYVILLLAIFLTFLRVWVDD